MLAAITAFANGIAVTPIDPNLVVSNAVTLQQGTIAAGGSRYEANLVAKYMFMTGQGATAYDTSGVTPAADLSLSGNYTWVGGWGVQFGPAMGNLPSGKAQASTSSSAKIAAMIQSSGEYSLEVWDAPADVTQTNAYILSYSGSNTTRDATLAQAAMQYQGMARSSTTSTNGQPPLLTTTTGGAAQAALQHVVITYDPVNGQKLYVNGVYTGDPDPAKGGSLANWDSTFALVLGNETTGQRPWAGVVKFAAIHNRALTAAQIQQNFAAGVGQKYFLLFGVSQLSGVPQSYILFQGSQYDNYSYLFDAPKFITLDGSAAAPSNLMISGMRLGVNGVLAPAGQSYATMAVSVGGANYSAGNGQLLSNLGTVVPVTLGPANDLFFLSFDQFGSHVHAFTEPPVVVTPPRAQRHAAAGPGHHDLRARQQRDGAHHRGQDHRRGRLGAVQHLAAVDAVHAADRRVRALAADRDLAAGERLLRRDDGQHHVARYVLQRHRTGRRGERRHQGLGLLRLERQRAAHPGDQRAGEQRHRHQRQSAGHQCRAERGRCAHHAHPHAQQQCHRDAGHGRGLHRGARQRRRDRAVI